MVALSPAIPKCGAVSLHFSACAARELNGNLTAHSAGLGSGASFVLALPLGAEVAAHASPSRAVA